MQILEELWYGEIRPMEKANYREEEYRELEGLLSRNEAHLRPTLNEKQLEDLQKLRDVWEEMDHIAECGAFIAGFRLAVQLMAASV